MRIISTLEGPPDKIHAVWIWIHIEAAAATTVRVLGDDQEGCQASRVLSYHLHTGIAMKA